MPVVLLAVPTRGGRSDLGILLRRLAGQAPPDGWQTRLLVLDNSPEGVEASRWATLTEGLAIPADLVHEPRRGIPIARNRIVQHATDLQVDAIAWTDDDDLPVDEHWLARHLTVLDDLDADGTCAPRDWRVPADASRWVRASGSFRRNHHPTGTRRLEFAGGNIVTRMRVFERVRPWFDEARIGHGGTDTEFSLRASRAGCRFVWVDDAVQLVEVPAERATFRWIMQRRLRTGGTRGWTQRHLDGAWSVANLRRVAVGMVRFLRGVLAVVIGIVPAVLGSRRATELAAQGMGEAAFGFGTVLGAALGWTHREYG